MDQSRMKDPVCGMDVSPREAKAKSEFEGDTYYFCSEGCKRKFDADMARYVREASVQPEIGAPPPNS